MSRALSVPKLCPCLGFKRRSRVSLCGHFYLFSLLDALHFPWRKGAHRLEVILCFSKKSISYGDEGFRKLVSTIHFLFCRVTWMCPCNICFCNLVEFLDSIIKPPLLHLLFFFYYLVQHFFMEMRKYWKFSIF